MTPKILIPSIVFEKIMFWVDKADFEVSGFGKCIFNGTNFEVKDAILLKQKGGTSHTDIEPESLSKAQYDLREQPGDLKFWWHSHVNMNTFMSGTDQTTLKELGSRGWAIATVFNKRREVTSAMAYAQTIITPFAGEKTELFYDDKIETLIIYPALTEAHKVVLTEQFDTNVSRGWLVPVTKAKTYVGFTYYEERAAEALGITPKAFRKRRKKASEKEFTELTEKIDIYWVAKRGYVIKDYQSEYTKALMASDTDDEDEIDLQKEFASFSEAEWQDYERMAAAYGAD